MPSSSNLGYKVNVKVVKERTITARTLSLLHNEPSKDQVKVKVKVKFKIKVKIKVRVNERKNSDTVSFSIAL